MILPFPMLSFLIIGDRGHACCPKLLFNTISHNILTYTSKSSHIAFSYNQLPVYRSSSSLLSTYMFITKLSVSLFSTTTI